MARDDRYRVKVRWLPWRPRVRSRSYEWADLVSFLDLDLPGALGVILGIIALVLFVVLILPIAFFVLELVAVVVVLALVLVLRFVFRRPWIVDVIDRVESTVTSYPAPHLRDARALKVRFERMLKAGAKPPPPVV